MAERNPAWIRDELILALDLYLQNATATPGKTSRQIHELSNVLNRLGQQLGLRRGAKFRNANGVYMKLMNFRRFDPEFQKAGKAGLKAGNQLEEVVWDEFAHNPAKLRATADAIRAYVAAGNVYAPVGVTEPTETVDEFEAPEGALLTREHVSRERNRKLVEQKKQLAMKKHGLIACEVCGFDFAKMYGERGIGFAECHHTTPLSALKPGAKTKLEDLSLLCANCHRMVHVRKPWLAVVQLRTMLHR